MICSAQKAPTRRHHQSHDQEHGHYSELPGLPPRGEDDNAKSRARFAPHTVGVGGPGFACRAWQMTGMLTARTTLRPPAEERRLNGSEIMPGLNPDQAPMVTTIHT